MSPKNEKCQENLCKKIGKPFIQAMKAKSVKTKKTKTWYYLRQKCEFGSVHIVERLGNDPKNAQIALELRLQNNFNREHGLRIDISVMTFYKEYMEYREKRVNDKMDESLALGTVLIDKRRLPKFVERYGQRPLASITPQDVEDFKLWLRNEVYNQNTKRKGYGPYGVNQTLGALRPMFAYAKTRNYIGQNPAYECKNLPTKKVGRILSHNEIDRLLKACLIPDLRNIVLVLLYTGMREKEVLTLQAEQILKSKTGYYIFLEPREKDGKEGTKGKEPRIVPILRPIEDILTKIKSGPIFPEWIQYDPKTGGFQPRRFQHAFWQAVNRAKVIDRKKGQRLRPHDLRHTTGTLLAESGIDFEVARMILGHINEKTFRIYAHLRPDFLTENMNKVSFGFFDLPPIENAKIQEADVVGPPQLPPPGV